MRVGIYARVSSDTEEQENALTQQLDRLRSAANGHQTIEFIDVMSGKRDDRPQLAELMQACKRGELDRVICTRLDRLSRSMAHGAELLIYFSAPDTPSLLSLDESLDLATTSGRLMANILISFAVAESDRLSERVRHGKNFHRKRLLPLGPFAPYGYRYNATRDNYELDPETAPHARTLVDQFLELQTLRPIVREAIKVPGCRIRDPFSLRHWLGNPTLAGYRCYGKYKSFRDKDGKLKKKMRQPWDREEMYPHCHPPLISEKEHEQIVKILRNHCNRTRSALTPRFVGKLTGLVRCAYCDRAMYYQHVETKKYEYLHCSGVKCMGPARSRIRADVVEAAIWAELRQHGELLLAMALGTQAMAAGAGSAEERLTEEIKELEARNDPDYEEAIERKKARLAHEIEGRMRQSFAQQEVSAIEEALQGDEFWELAKGDPSRCRAFFSELVDRVMVRGNKIEEIKLRMPNGAALLASARLTASDPEQYGARPQRLSRA